MVAAPCLRRSRLRVPLVAGAAGLLCLSLVACSGSGSASPVSTDATLPSAADASRSRAWATSWNKGESNGKMSASFCFSRMAAPVSKNCSAAGLAYTISWAAPTTRMGDGRVLAMGNSVGDRRKSGVCTGNAYNLAMLYI